MPRLQSYRRQGGCPAGWLGDWVLSPGVDHRKLSTVLQGAILCWYCRCCCGLCGAAHCGGAAIAAEGGRLPLPACVRALLRYFAVSLAHPLAAHTRRRPTFSQPPAL